MFEKVNKYHPDKVADRIAGALVDKAYLMENNPRIAVEVLIGHGTCTIIAETSVHLSIDAVTHIVKRISENNDIIVNYIEVPQDSHLADNQKGTMRCGDNGIFKGCPVTTEQYQLCAISRAMEETYKSDGKYIISKDSLIICQSNAHSYEIERMVKNTKPNVLINPLGEWTGGVNVDSGATNRKLGSDMGNAVTGGGLHGKDLSKADVTLNIYAHLLAQQENRVIRLKCAIGDEFINGHPYSEIVDVAREYIKKVGGFEKFAEHGLVD